jgi:hypothetical protein
MEKNLKVLRKKELTKIVKKASEELSLIRIEENLVEAQKYVPGYYKYRNSNGKIFWDLYIEALSTKDGTFASCFQFEGGPKIDERSNEYTVKCNETSFISFLKDDCTRITEIEFQKAWISFQDTIKNLVKE